ncbi:MAG TPA: hypothetical protein VGM03_04950 [Phycisphaerae bacterium]|jgi:anti-sigma factor RsiW
MSADIERLIVRKLDGELSADEQLALDRAVLRDPEARRMLEDYQQIDALAAQILDERLSGAAATANGELRIAQDGAERPIKSQSARRLPAATGNPQSRYSRWWWLLPAAAAAALFVPLMLRTTTPTALQPAVVIAPQPVVDEPVPRALQPMPVSSPVRRAASVSDQAIDQDVYYVVGDDGRIYMIEHERQQDFTRERGGARVLPAGGL